MIEPNLGWFFFPQFLLTFYAPSAGYLLWRLVMKRNWVTSVEWRFRVTFLIAVLPALIWFVPYWPHSFMRHLPYMVPLVWGVDRVPAGLFDASVLGFYGALARFFFILPFLFLVSGIVVAIVFAGAEYISIALKIMALPRYRDGQIIVLQTPGEMAFTFGLIRPRIYMGETVWRGPHREAVLAHEKAHVRRRDPLLLLVVRSVRRSIWYLPFWSTILRQLELDSECVCDSTACRQVGLRKYAEALLAVLPSKPGQALRTRDLTTSFCSKAASNNLLERVRQLTV